jgi:hypothetical protein
VRLLPLILSLLALALAGYAATTSPADAPPVPAPDTPLSAARFFVLLPDGRVELSDAWSRRVFRWDDGRWVEAESLASPRAYSRQ